jgi:hypothetical protein
MHTGWIGSASLFFALWAWSGAVFSAGTEGNLYRWTDADGRTLFSDQPPAGKPYTTVPRAPDPSPEAAAAARERAEAVQRMADDLARERRLREERAAAARPPPPQPEPTPAEPRVEIRHYPWYPSRPHWPIRPWPPVYPPWHPPRPPHGHPGERPPGDASPRPPAWTPPRRAPEFQWPRPRAPEFQN